MTPHLHDVLDPQTLQSMLVSKHVKKQTHPEHPELAIYNYTAQTQWAKEWNPTTLTCRGLITRDDRIIARPFPKFFNLAEHPDQTLPDGPVHVTEKLDGSLGILYPHPAGGHAIATRGSFASDQARHATNTWNARYAARFQPNPDWTYLFEIVYPQNRVVVNYHDTDDLFLLGATDTRTGRSIPLDHARTGWPGPVVPELQHTTLHQALAHPIRPGSEGIVVHFTETDLRVKIKDEEYVRLHRIVTGVSERRIWEALSAGDDLTPWLEAVPDECYDFVTQTQSHLTGEHDRLTRELTAKYHDLLATLGKDSTRKQFAEAANTWQHPLARGLFLLLDGKDTSDLIWRHLRPTEHRPMWGGSEDTN